MSEFQGNINGDNKSESVSKTGSLKITPKSCVYFQSGSCRNGDSCRFSHNIDNSNFSKNSAPSSTKITIPHGQPVFSIDVECVATGVEHHARAIAQVAMVDEWSNPVFNVFIKPEVPVLSYITELTGINKEMLESYGMPLADAMAYLRSRLSPNAVLVGQNILKDVQWLQLVEGVDYHSLIDLAGLFRVWNPVRNEYTTFSQDHCAKVWLGIYDRDQHNAVADASISMSLFNAYRSIQWDDARLAGMQKLLMDTPRAPGFSASHPSVDGCCMGNRRKCTCGAAFF